jgi:hypothetical protein
MTPQEIQERNKQIAVMLGWNEATLEYKLRWCAVPTEERLNRLDQDDVPILMKENKDPLWSSSLLWHSDWNWLMEAVEFIEKVYNNQPIYFGHKNCVIFSPKTIKSKGKDKKEAVFIAVSDFAKLYNEKKL